jgi:hypothetical protein
MKIKSLLTLLLLASTLLSAKKIKTEVFSQEEYGKTNTGSPLSIRFEKGKEHNHPLFAIWLCDKSGKYIQTLYVSESIGKGVFTRANRSTGKWLPGEIQRPAALPYWTHQRGIKNEYGNFLPTPKQPVVDAYTGATPSGSFVLKVKTEQPLNGEYKIMLEINQSWDWNEWWTNNRFPEDKEYKTSSQPALVYVTTINTNNRGMEYELKPIGHSHYSGKDGSLTTDLSSITTALKIAKRITVSVD